jgi:hypothetical protein
MTIAAEDWTFIVCLGFELHFRWGLSYPSPKLSHAAFDSIDIPSVDRSLDRTVDKAFWAFGKFLADNPNFPTAAVVS